MHPTVQTGALERIGLENEAVYVPSPEDSTLAVNPADWDSPGPTNGAPHAGVQGQADSPNPHDIMGHVG
jgi:hypothetical protein